MKAGPKGEGLDVGPLDLSMLPGPGSRRVAAFATEFLTPSQGKGAGQPFRLRPWQKRMVGLLFPARGARPRQAVFSLPRGNGKTSLAAVLGAYGLLADGVRSAEVLVVASDARQATITLNKVVRMVKLDPRLEEQCQIFSNKIYVPSTDSTLAVLPAEQGALQGWNPSLAICDELHVMTRPCWDAMALAAGKRKGSLTLAISTPGASRDGVLWDLVEYGRRRDDPSFVLVEYAAPDGCPTDDEDAWLIANPAAGDFLYLDALRSTLKTTRETEFRRFRLGQWPLHAERWLSGVRWQECTDLRPIPDGAEVVLAVDGSFEGDVAGIVAVEVGEMPHIDVVRLWEPPADAVPGEMQVDVREVEDTIRKACDRWTVLEVNADPYRWSRVLQLLEAEGINAVEFPQTPARMSPATQRFGEAVMGGLLTHSADPALSRHVLDAAVKVDDRGMRLVKPGPGHRIDLAVCAVMAHDRAAQADELGYGQPQIWFPQ